MEQCPSCYSTELRPVELRRTDFSLLQCTGCQLRFQPLEREDLSIYGDDYYEHWHLEKGFDAVWQMKVASCQKYLEMVERFQNHSEQQPRQLLDIGCAHGFMLEAGQRKGYQVFGIEVSPAVEYAKQRGFPAFRGDLSAAKLSDGSQDIVTLIDVIEHIPSPRPLLQEIWRVLRPGGKLFLVTPDVGSYIARALGARWPHYKVEHVCYYSRPSLTRLLEGAGFRVDEARAGFKYLTFDYIEGHFARFTGGLPARLLHFMRKIVPERLATANLRYVTEMIAIAGKTEEEHLP